MLRMEVDMTNADNHSAPSLGGVFRDGPHARLDSDNTHARQRLTLFSILGAVAVICLLAGFYSPAFWVIAFFSGFGAAVSLVASPGYRVHGSDRFEPIETGASREFMPGTSEWNNRMMRNHGE